ncbi:hypothetical protein E2C01_051048 [Portunus trituberculatus]|uniref:Uncharacterized protein n=1 Tax=Portunus trituberculatus TaxID=210409 RepID=A0A5B7GHK6_PORTR|nr:hypothetical protein [Portunus trituberculatus]
MTLPIPHLPPRHHLHRHHLRERNTTQAASRQSLTADESPLRLIRLQSITHTGAWRTYSDSYDDGDYNDGEQEGLDDDECDRKRLKKIVMKLAL